MTRTRLKTWAAALFPVAVGLAIFFVVSHQESFASGPQLECEFASRPDQPAVRLGNVTAPLQAFKLSGALSNRSDNQIYDFKGHASYRSNDRQREFAADGLVRIADSGTVIGFSFGVGGFPNSSPEFGRDGLSVATLGPDGYLGDDPSTAYLFTSATFKTSYPTTYSCKAVGFDPKQFPPPTTSAA